VLLVGLTGGIGSGKSTVARLLQARGAVIFDADELARLAIDPGTPGHDRVVERFGPDVVTDDGAVDRQALAGIVFADDRARSDLEAIVFPEVLRRLLEGVEAHRDSDRIVVFDAPLIVEAGMAAACDLLVLVTSRQEDQVARLVADRGMSEEEVGRRIAAQLPDDEKARSADVVIRNEGTLEDLEGRVDALWAELQGRAKSPDGRRYHPDR
jgi:dephospho-CoA kinase